MASETNPNDQEMALEIEEEHYYESRFLSAKCAQKYDEYLNRAIVKDKCIFLEYLKEGMPDIYGQLISSGWMCFADEHIKENYTLVAEFYTNVIESKFGEYVITIVRVEIKSWLSIVCAQIILSTHDTNVTLNRDVLIGAIRDGCSTMLGVVKRPIDEEKKLGKEINPLKKKGKERDRSKNRKIDMDDPGFGQLTKIISAFGASTFTRSSKYGPATMRNFSSQMRLEHFSQRKGKSGREHSESLSGERAR
ncbi:hypothetical protein KY290_026620 [Solanum tuberosum]|uniref:Uncharacterized protein n=1 Tax=Solanum tuberosum TaxID=4113 RepID=A0ABQ7UWZ9_SOLTU|nr:hypothetical protein KY284_023624 [Solanum tuberosum]KAH0756350.1 hypothetical protein KY290_026620 [Solanum tuberosum]